MVKKMLDIKTYESLSTNGKDLIIYASWTIDGLLHTSCGHMYEGGLLEVSTIEDGIVKVSLAKAPYVNEVLNAIEAYRESLHFDILKAELYKSYKINEENYHLSDHDLYFCINGKHIRYKPAATRGLYQVFEDIQGNKETLVGYKLLSVLEYSEMKKYDNNGVEAK